MSDSTRTSGQLQFDFSATEEIPYGYCQCGCGQLTPIAKEKSTRRGHIKGQPMRFVHGHNTTRRRVHLDDIDLPSGARSIPLTNDKVAIVDAVDYEWLSQWRWIAHKQKRTWYAVRTEYFPGGGRRTIKMHRLIIGAEAGLTVDHRDGDGLNNRRENLRSATQDENIRNRRRHSNNTSGYKGVGLDRNGDKWRARITVNGKQIRLGSFATPEEAAAAYDAAALKLHGEFAKTNAMVSDD